MAAICKYCKKRKANAYFKAKPICGRCWTGRNYKQEKPSTSKFMKELIEKYGYSSV